MANGATTDTQRDMAWLTGRLKTVNKSLSRLNAERFALMAEIDKLLNADGTNGRVASAAVAAASKCSTTQANGELELARKLAALPAVREAFENGEITTGQIGAVAQIASPGDEAHALDLAKTASTAVLEREAAARRRDLFEKRVSAERQRFVTFKPNENDSTITMIGRGPWAEMHWLQQRLEKIAAQIGKGTGDERPRHSARMFDALMTLGAENISTRTKCSGTIRAATPKVATPRFTAGPVGAVGVVDETETETSAEVDFDEDFDRLFFDDPDEPFPADPDASVVVTRADVKVVVHYDARTGLVNYQNGPPIDHPRFMALLSQASIELIHYDKGSPNGIVTTQRCKTDRQARYLAHRDGPCRVPECPGIGYTHAHHLTHAMVLPGVTETAGLINLCHFHHNQHHDRNLTITGNAERSITFTWTNGQTVTATHNPP